MSGIILDVAIAKIGLYESCFQKPLLPCMLVLVEYCYSVLKQISSVHLVEIFYIRLAV